MYIWYNIMLSYHSCRHNDDKVQQPQRFVSFTAQVCMRPGAVQQSWYGVTVSLGGQVEDKNGAMPINYSIKSWKEMVPVTFWCSLELRFIFLVWCGVGARAQWHLTNMYLGIKPTSLISQSNQRSTLVQKLLQQLLYSERNLIQRLWI